MMNTTSGIFYFSILHTFEKKKTLHYHNKRKKNNFKTLSPNIFQLFELKYIFLKFTQDLLSVSCGYYYFTPNSTILFYVKMSLNIDLFHSGTQYDTLSSPIYVIKY